MQRQDFYPSRIADQVSWLTNYKNKLPTYGGALGLAAAEITATVADANWLIYVLGAWIGYVRSSSQSATEYLALLQTGLPGGSSFPVPIFIAPAPATGVEPVAAGAVNRLLRTVQGIKEAPGYTTAIGDDLGVIGAAINPDDHPVPKFKLVAEQGGGCQCVKVSITRYTHEGTYTESKRNGGVWEQVGITTARTLLDERPLLSPTTPEVREYRMRYWDRGIANGPWTDVGKVTVAP